MASVEGALALIRVVLLPMHFDSDADAILTHPSSLKAKLNNEFGVRNCVNRIRPARRTGLFITLRRYRNGGSFLTLQF